MVAGGLKGDKTGEVSLATAGKTRPEDVQVWGGTGGGRMGNDGFPPER